MNTTSKTESSRTNRRQKKRTVGRPHLSRSLTGDDQKEVLSRVARRHFAAYGFHGASLSEIAKDAKVANSLINYHFQDKEGLFQFCINSFAVPWVDTLQRILSEPKSQEDLRVRIELFVNEVSGACLKEPEVFAIIKREMPLGLPHIRPLFETTIGPCFESAFRFFKAAQKNQLIQQHLGPDLLAKLLFNLTFESLDDNEACGELLGLSLKDERFRKQTIQHVVHIFFKGITRETP